MLKGTRLYSILFNKCPRCHKGQFFKNNNPYDLTEFSEMHEHCEHCDESFIRETGYYYGAMYVSYGLNIALGVAMFLLMVLILEIDVVVYLFSFLGATLLFFPWVFRTARLVWINLFVGYKPEATKEAKH